MAQTADQTLEQRIADLEASVRALRTTNPFGLVADTDPIAIDLAGVANTAGGTGWVAGTPSVELYVASGRLRVEVAAALNVSGNKASAFMSWAIRGPAEAQEVLDAAPIVVDADYTRAVELQHQHSGQDARFAGSTFGTHPDLDPGWYRIGGRYALTYSGTAYAPWAQFTNRRLSAMPY